METLSRRNRSSSIPRNYTKINSVSHQFLEEDAALLITQLFSIERLISQAAHIKDLNFGKALKPNATIVYLAKSAHKSAIEALLKFVQKNYVRRPRGVANAYTEAYEAAIDGRVYFNKKRFEDVEKLLDCTCSEALQVMPAIDEAIGTSLLAHFNTAYAKVKPFPLLSMPAELRLAVYSYALPRSKDLMLNSLERRGLYQRQDFELFRVSKCMNAEVTKYFYENMRLNFFCSPRIRYRATQQNCQSLFFALVNARLIASFMRRLITTFVVMVDMEWEASLADMGDVVDANDFAEILRLFDNLKAVQIAFRNRMDHGSRRSLFSPAVKCLAIWLAKALPPNVEVSWTFQSSCIDEERINEVRLALEHDGGNHVVKVVEGPLHTI